MGSFKKLLFKFCEKQWVIGIAQCSMAEVIREKKIPHSFRWIKPSDVRTSYADPFILDMPGDRVHLLFEEYTTGHYDGIIKSMTLNSTLEIIDEQIILKSNTHLSYPFPYFDNEKLYLFPEMGRSGAMCGYEYEPQTTELKNKCSVIETPLIDATILKYKGQYWIFATPYGNYSQQQLHIYYSDNLFGPYYPHNKNPVKTSISGTRPAGNFILVDGEIYRPSQNCKNYYGESITIQKITLLNKNEYQEENYCILKPPRAGRITLGMHTINGSAQWIAIDALVGKFSPFRKIRKKLLRSLNK